MAANFWASTHGTHWLLNRQQLINSRKDDLKYINEHELTKVNIWFAKIITDLGKSLQVRQIIIATAITYFKRFYTKNSYRGTEPYLVAATCMYLACKIEESPHHIKTVISEMKKLTEGKGGFPYENQKVAEMEFYLMEELDFKMIVFHPYRALATLAKDLGTNSEDVQNAWWVLNDTYRTDMCLLYPPHVIAAAALYLPIALKGENNRYGDNDDNDNNNNNNTSPSLTGGGGVGGEVGGVITRGAKKGQVAAATTASANSSNNNNETSKIKDIREWFAHLNVDLEQITDIVQEIISLYELWAEYNEEKPQEILQRLLKK